MDIVKKNLLSIICGVVAVLAIVAAFWPMGGMFDSLNVTVKESKKNFDAINTLDNTPFTKPNLDPKESSTKNLEQFPTPDVIAQGKDAVTKMHAQAEDLVKSAVQRNRRKPIWPAALPDGNGVQRINFKIAYYEKMAEIKTGLGAATPVTEFELNAEAKRIWETVYKDQIIIRNGQAQNKVQVDAAYAAEKLALPEKMRISRAQNSAMYFVTEKASLDFHPLIPSVEDNKPPELVDVWAAQLGFWITEDVATAILKTNLASPGAGGRLPTVENAIIKKLTRIEDPKQYITKTGALPVNSSMNFSGQNAGLRPANPPAGPETGFTRMYGISPTGRICNDTYDVMHFTVTLDADARYFRQFITNLTDGRFITVLRCDIRAVDRETVFKAAGYVYGPDPVVTCVLKCEAVFFREWTKPMMPKQVKDALNIREQPASVAEGR